MKKYKNLLPVIILFSVVSSCEVEQLTPVILPESYEAIVTYLSGEVYVKKGNIWEEVEIGDHLVEGDRIKTVEYSYCEIQFGEKAVIRLKENTTLKLNNILHSTIESDIQMNMLVGTVLCKIEKLVGQENFSVSSEANIFGVRGTEFLIQKNRDETTVAVLKGIVGLLPVTEGEEEILIKDKEQITIDDITSVRGAVQDASMDFLQELKQIQELKVLKLDKESEKELVKVVIYTKQINAEIYFKDILVGIGNYSGIFTEGEELEFTIRKSGYNEKMLTVSVDSDRKTAYIVDLEVSDEDGFTEPSEEEQDTTYLELESLKDDYNQLVKERDDLSEELDNLEEQVSSFLTQLDIYKKDNAALTNRVKALEEEKKRLEQEIVEKDELLSSLKALLEE